MGSAAVHHLAARGARVLGLEQFDIPHDLGSSHGLSRIIRLAYWEHPLYVPLVRRASALGRDLEQSARERLLVVTGCVDASAEASRQIAGVKQACRMFDLAHEEFDAASLAARFPGYRLPAECVAIYQPDGGFLLPERCITAGVEAARSLGAAIPGRAPVPGWDPTAAGVRVRTTRDTYTATRLVLTAGPWTAQLAPRLASALTVERQVVLWTRPLRADYFEATRFPVFYIEIDAGAF